jgi:predicted nucleotidyltransferase component of viral defense system
MDDLKNLECLLPDTRKLLIKLRDTCQFLHHYVLVGGSALSLHLCHRKSEDLDFFTYDTGFSQKELFDFFSLFRSKEILNQTDEQIDVLLDGVKVTFFDAKWSFLKPKRPAAQGQLNLATLDQLAAMKVNVLFLRAKYRDYYDLYILAKEVFSLRDIFRVSEQIVKGVTYKLFMTALLYIDDIEDDDIAHLEPKEQVTKKQIREFFETGSGVH